MQSVPITHHQRCEFESHSWLCVLDTTLCDKVYQQLATGQWLSTVLRFPPPISGVKHHNHPLIHLYPCIYNFIALSYKQNRSISIMDIRQHPCMIFCKCCRIWYSIMSKPILLLKMKRVRYKNSTKSHKFVHFNHKIKHTNI